MIAVPCAVVLGACGDYPHDNPYDPSADTRITIRGPDSVHSLFTRTVFTAEVSPHGEIATPRWRSSDSTVVSVAFDGAFVAAKNGSVDVIVLVGDRRASRPFVVWQIPRSARFACFANPCATLAHGGDTLTIPVTQLDSAGGKVVGGAPWVPLQYASLDPGIVAIDALGPSFATLRAVAPGTTFVTLAFGTRLDSARVTVTAP